MHRILAQVILVSYHALQKYVHIFCAVVSMGAKLQVMKTGMYLNLFKIARAKVPLP